jgi:SAM-dependent methyltransferase
MLLKTFVRSALHSTTAGSRFLLRRKYGVRGPHGRPDAPWSCAVLKSEHEVRCSIEQVQRLGLPLVGRTAANKEPKNWDSLAALELILKNTDPRARIFDAGGERYSMILPWLALYGYRDLTAGNLVFEQPIQEGPIRYEHQDITQTTYPNARFDAITCLSVIEHGVDLAAYFKEMARILKPGGLLITSTDYYDSPVDTRGQVIFGVPIHVFSPDEITHALELAAASGLELVAPLNLTACERAVTWAQYDLSFTFIVVSMRKVG